MSKWHGGKGDKNRTGDYNAYASNFDKIFRKKDMMIEEEILRDHRILAARDKSEAYASPQAHYFGW